MPIIRLILIPSSILVSAYIVPQTPGYAEEIGLSLALLAGVLIGSLWPKI